MADGRICSVYNIGMQLKEFSNFTIMVIVNEWKKVKLSPTLLNLNMNFGLIRMYIILEVLLILPNQNTNFSIIK